MKAAPRNPRWAISFADLALLLLSFSVMYQMASIRGREDMPRPFGSSAVATPLFDQPAQLLFDEGEARLTPDARARFNELGRQTALRKQALEVRSTGSASGGARFDRWELTAARAAAVARALAEGGMAQDRIDLVLPPLARGSAARPQRIVVRGA